MQQSQIYHVEKLIEISSLERDISIVDSSIYNFTVRFDETFRNIFKIELMSASIHLENDILDQTIYLTIDEIPGNFTSGNPLINNAFCCFSNNNTAINQNAKTTWFPHFEKNMENIIPGLNKFTVRIHNRENKSSYSANNLDKNKYNDKIVSIEAAKTVYRDTIIEQNSNKETVANEVWGSRPVTQQTQSINPTTINHIAILDNYATFESNTDLAKQVQLVFKLTYEQHRFS